MTGGLVGVGAVTHTPLVTTLPFVLQVLIAELGVAYTHGLQIGDEPRYIKVAGCGKHYAVHNVRFTNGFP